MSNGKTQVSMILTRDEVEVTVMGLASAIHTIKRSSNSEYFVQPFIRLKERMEKKLEKIDKGELDV